MLVDSRVHIDACRLMMGSIEIEESIVARLRGMLNSIENSIYDKLQLRQQLHRQVPGISGRDVANETFRASTQLSLMYEQR